MPPSVTWVTGPPGARLRSEGWGEKGSSGWLQASSPCHLPGFHEGPRSACPEATHSPFPPHPSFLADCHACESGLR